MTKFWNTLKKFRKKERVNKNFLGRHERCSLSDEDKQFLLYSQVTPKLKRALRIYGSIVYFIQSSQKSYNNKSNIKHMREQMLDKDPAKTQSV